MSDRLARYGTYTFDPALLADLVDELEELGLWEVVRDPEVTDLVVNDNGHAFAYRPDGPRRLPAPLPRLGVESVVAHIATLHGRTVSADSPILEATLPLPLGPGETLLLRVQANVPPIVPAATLVVRKPPARLIGLEELVGRGMLDAEAARRLGEGFAGRATLLVAGGVGSGKTTLAGALVGHLLEVSPTERLVILEEGARELRVDADNVTRLLTHPAAGVTMTRLVANALRLYPDRLILGEARGAEALDFVKAANTGHPGSLTTLHANSAGEALKRLDALAQEAGVPSQMERVREAVDLVVHVERRTEKGRVVRRVREVVGV